MPATSQIISPGKLAEPHAALEGIRSCTRCHRLGRAGVSRELCLECHAPLGRRIAEGTGFHTSLEDDDCATCHKDHLGRGFDMLRFDTLSFRHADAGYDLAGAHREVGCRDCHRPGNIAAEDVREHFVEAGSLARTWLGVTTSCADCHVADDPHGPQFPGRPCTDCHEERSWEGAERFDHGRTAYPLTGRHAVVACAGCHQGGAGAGGAVRYRPLLHRGCDSCHEDPHGGAMDGSCGGCHATSGWSGVARSGVEGHFDHASTGFLLEGRHASAACAACHDPARAVSIEGLRLSFGEDSRGRTFPRPRADGCGSCHEDAHDGAFQASRGGSACEGCHGVDGWFPADYGIARHNREADYPLQGAHLTVPCGSCHRSPEEQLVLRPASDRCAACHGGTNPHGGQFADRDCDACHVVASFAVEDFDHGATRFPLDGAHGDLACASCHTPERGGTVRYAPLGVACRDCHAGGGG